MISRPLVEKARDRDRPFPRLSEVALLGSSRLPGEVWSAKHSYNLMMRSCLVLVLAGFGAPVADVVLEVPLSDEFFNLIFECDAFSSGMANTSQ